MRQLAWAVLFVAACTGPKGDKGDPGQSGMDGQSTTVTAEPPGSNCANGGVKLTSGSLSDFVCNGINGTGSLVVAPEPAGANCSSGGLKITSSSGTNYVCNGSSGGGITTANEPAGANCASGGVKITSSSGTSYVCNGAPGSGGSAKMVLDSGGNVLGEFLSFYYTPTSSNGNAYPVTYEMVYRDSSGLIVQRRPDGTLDPFFTQVVYYDAPLCQGTPYTYPLVIGGFGNTGGLPAGAFVQIGVLMGMTQPYFFKVSTTALKTVTVAGNLDNRGNCNAGSQTITNALTLVPVTTPPAATVPGPLAIQ